MMTSFGLYGSGWRAEFFLRAAKALPQRFRCIGVITRNEEKARYFTKEFGVKCYTTAELLLTDNTPAFMVVSVNASVSTDITLGLLRKGLPILMETPPAPNLDKLKYLQNSMPKDALLQIAEQYPLQPMHMARLTFLRMGKLGTLQHAQISYTHGFHAMALMRRYLDIGIEDAKITAVSFPISVVAGYTRTGEPAEERIVEKQQTIALLDFGGKTGLLNFESDQHRSWVRSPIIQIKGERGEVFNHKIKYLQDFKTPVESDFIRKDLGREENFEGFDLKGIFADGEWLYRNPYCGSRLTDDEIAVAACMDGMVEYINGGSGFYGLHEAAHDLYLSIKINDAIKMQKERE